MKKGYIIIHSILSFVIISCGCINSNDNNNDINDDDIIIDGLDSISYSLYIVTDDTNIDNNSFIIIPILIQNKAVIPITSNDLNCDSKKYDVSSIESDYGTGVKINPIPLKQQLSTIKTCEIYSLNIEDPYSSNDLPKFSLLDSTNQKVWIYSTVNLTNLHVETYYSTTNIKTSVSTNILKGWHQYSLEFIDERDYD